MPVQYRYNATTEQFEPVSGAPGVPGPQGDDGWSPVLATVADGARLVLQVADWTGGEGTKPATGMYVGATGLTAVIGDAVNIRGTTGPTGDPGVIQSPEPPPDPEIGTIWVDTDADPYTVFTVEPYVMGITGALSVRTGASRVYLEENYEVESVRASVNTAPTGSSIIFDLKKNGTTMFTTTANRPTIAAGSNLSTGTLPDVIAFAPGDYFTVDVLQVGSTLTGSDAIITIRLRRIG